MSDNASLLRPEHKNNVHCLSSNPLIKHKITLLRDQKTSPKDFREILEEMTFVLLVEASKHIKYKAKHVTTPLATYEGIKVKNSLVVPIMRAGLGMMNPLLKLLPACQLGFMGVARNEEDCSASVYYKNIPAVKADTTVFVLDPMLATGGSMCKALEELEKQGATSIVILCILSTTVGIETVLKEYPQVTIYTAEIDPELNTSGFIVPGLGDAGDRIFNTVK